MPAGKTCLKRVGIERARGLIAAVGTDAENVYAVLTARVLRPDLFIVGRAETEDATIKLKRAGADRVISPYQIGAVADGADGAAAGRRRFRRAGDQHRQPRARRWRKSRSRANSALAEPTLVDANLRQRFGVIVVGIQRRRSGAWNSIPTPDMHDSRRRQAGRARPAGFAQTTRNGGALNECERLRVLDGTAVANQIRRSFAGRGGVYRARRPAARAWASCWSATTRRPTSTSAPS